MKLVCAVVSASLLCASCGIQTIEYLPSPQVQSYLNQTDLTRLTFTHDAGVYSSTPDFQGYEVYYRIYAPLFGTFDNLANDVGRLAATPTKDYLVTLGYQRLNAADDRSTIIPLVRGLTSSGTETVTLDFSNFLTIMSGQTPPTAHTGATIAPRPQLELGDGSASDVFRSVAVAGVFSFPWFSDLYGSFQPASDINAVNSSPTVGSDNSINQSTANYEIDVFLVAFAFTPERSIYSQPVPWGVIGYLGVP